MDSFYTSKYCLVPARNIFHPHLWVVYVISDIVNSIWFYFLLKLLAHATGGRRASPT